MDKVSFSIPLIVDLYRNIALIAEVLKKKNTFCCQQQHDAN
jgi:hypothetical protein